MIKEKARDVVGHDDAIQQFEAARRSGRLHHAWLITGTPQIGKTTLALFFARTLLNAMDPKSPISHRFEAGTHGDLLVITRGASTGKGGESQTIIAADIKPVQQLLHHTAAEGGWRVVIVAGGDLLNNFAANALLKLLEEPPEKTVFFITADNAAAVIPTIRSRCHKLFLHPLKDADMQVFLARHQLTDADMNQRLVSQAKGRPGYALELASRHHDDLSSLVEALASGASRALSPAQAERIAKEERSFSTFCDLLQERIREAALSSSRKGDKSAANRAAEIYQKLIYLRHETDRFNLDRTLAALKAAAMIGRL